MARSDGSVGGGLQLSIKAPDQPDKRNYWRVLDIGGRMQRETPHITLLLFSLERSALEALALSLGVPGGLGGADDHDTHAWSPWTPTPAGC